ncbi:MAG: NAD-dependent epimerase/dehydratase family protein [Alphaproteobacteria bacterium]|nr:NAD-dependent epimerase/dehydratase family protein [Alphaproteobacteria bacterium]
MNESVAKEAVILPVEMGKNGKLPEGDGRQAILLTGASSQIGRCVLRRLDVERRAVVAVGRRRLDGMAHSGAQFIECDLAQQSISIPHILSSVVHIAGIWLLPPHIEALYDKGVRRIVCFSSTSIYVKQESSNSGERDLVQRMLAAEADIAQRCDALGIEWTVLRPTLVYGMGIDRNISRAARFIRRFRCYPIAFGAEGLRQPVHADDLADAALSALSMPSAVGRRYDVGGGETLPYREMIGRIFDTLGLPRLFLPLPFLEHAAAAAGILLNRPEVTGEMVRRMRRDLVCDNRPAANDLGYAPRRFLAGGKTDLGLVSTNDVDTRPVA